MTMKEIKVCVFVTLLCVIAITVQSQAMYRKPVVFVDYFSDALRFGPSYVETLRNHVIEGLQATTRLDIIDVESQDRLNSVEQRQQMESAMEGIPGRNVVMNDLGADYVIMGHLVAVKAARSGVDSKGNALYDVSLQWDIKVVDARSGILRLSRLFPYSASKVEAKSRDEAVIGLMYKIRGDMDRFVDDAFPIEGSILQIDTEKSKKAKTVIIDLGSGLGILKGQKFSVFQEIDIAGETSRREIGTLTAQEVLSNGRTLCKVNKGNEEIWNAMNAGRPLIILSRKLRTILY